MKRVIKCSYDSLKQSWSKTKDLKNEVKAFLTDNGYTVVRMEVVDEAEYEDFMLVITLLENDVWDAADLLMDKFHPDSCDPSDTSKYNKVHMHWYND